MTTANERLFAGLGATLLKAGTSERDASKVELGALFQEHAALLAEMAQAHLAGAVVPLTIGQHRTLARIAEGLPALFDTFAKTVEVQLERALAAEAPEVRHDPAMVRLLEECAVVMAALQREAGHLSQAAAQACHAQDEEVN
jgi:hypothetical protein